MIQILGLLGMHFDAVVVEVKTFLLLFRLALAILCLQKEQLQAQTDHFDWCDNLTQIRFFFVLEYVVDGRQYGRTITRP